MPDRPLTPDEEALFDGSVDRGYSPTGSDGEPDHAPPGRGSVSPSPENSDE
jgi:hypothetical protein